MILSLVFLTTLAALELLRRYAAPLGLVAHPGAHRQHGQPTPLVGGLGIFAGVTLGACLLPLEPAVRQALLVPGAVLVAVGIRDDVREVSFIARFVAQALAVSFLALLADVSLQNLGYLFNTEYPLYLGRWGMALTVFAATGVINALNMSDGLDGLAGGLSLVTCGALLCAAFLAGQLAYVPMLGIVVAALAAFMLYNLRLPRLGAARLYLGNTGSLLLGFLLAWLLIGMSQGATRALAPVTALWLFALPLFDAVGALLRRPLAGRSPFGADRSHHHHYLIDLGLGVNQTLAVLLSAALGLAAVGLILEFCGVPEHISFYAFLTLFVMHVGGMRWLAGYLHQRRDPSHGSSEVESGGC